MKSKGRKFEMNVYTAGDYQNHCVVARDMKTAIKLWEDAYQEEPENLKIISEYVIVEAL